MTLIAMKTDIPLQKITFPASDHDSHHEKIDGRNGDVTWSKPPIWRHQTSGWLEAMVAMRALVLELMSQSWFIYRGNLARVVIAMVQKDSVLFYFCWVWCLIWYVFMWCDVKGWYCGKQVHARTSKINETLEVDNVCWKNKWAMDSKNVTCTCSWKNCILWYQTPVCKDTVCDNKNGTCRASMGKDAHWKNKWVVASKVFRTLGNPFFNIYW